ncbi:oligosaccharyl transferase alpha subunit, partial [Auriculariales sp. MPI-PUGE-AT-0066]
MYLTRSLLDFSKSGSWARMTMLARLSLLTSLASVALALNVPRSFENVNIVRSVELGGALTLTSTVYQLRALEDGATEYTVTLSKNEGDHTSWFVSKLKDVELDVTRGFDATDNVYYYTIRLPEPVKRSQDLNIVVGTTLSHAAKPWPASAGQRDPQRLKFTSDLLILSPYETLSQRTKIKSPTPKIASFEDPEPHSAFAKDSQVTHSGSTVTYGPFASVPASTSQSFQKEHQKPIFVSYEIDNAVVSIISLNRVAEISHWGANLNIQDDIHLVNGGPKLKGHFSRVEHQHSKYYGRQNPSTLASLTLYLPPGISNTYFTDQNGNVSTSHFRGVPSVPQDQSPFLHPELFAGATGKKAIVGKFSALEITPRYPLLGGWNYSFTLGWDAPLADWAGVKGGKYYVAVPFLNTFKDVPVNDAELKIILPEGATDVSVQTPFEVDSTVRSTHISYLDTVGRPAITLRKAMVTDKHDGMVYVSYKVPTYAHFKKPLVVATAMVGIFAFGLVARRVDPRIHTTGDAATRKKQ